MQGSLNLFSAIIPKENCLRDNGFFCELPSALGEMLECTIKYKTTNQITKRLQTFINKCLRRIMNIKWIDKITNEELWRITKQKPIEI
jgi:hypothetical protein